MNIDGTAGADHLSGTAAADLIRGLAGNDYINGQDGADTLDGGADSDTIYGGNGADLILGGTGDDELHGGQGTDVLSGGAGNDTLHGEGGTDQLDGGDGFDIADYHVNTTPVVANLVTGVVSFAGQIWAPEQLVSIEGVWTGSGNDTLTGDGQANDLRGGAGSDLIDGAGGADHLEGGAGADTLDGGAGNDTLYGDSSRYSYDTAGDLIRGGAGDDWLHGGYGNDTLEGGTGTDHLDGGGGLDIALYEANTTRVVVDLVAGEVSFTGQNWSPETLVSIEGAVTGSGADSLIGNEVANFLSGGLGNDTLIGGGGDDTLVGGGGRDVLDGGAGNDMAVYAENTTPIRADLGTGVITFVGQSWPAEVLSSIESLTTGSGNDTITGTDGENTILAGAGRDSLVAGGGDDHLDGGTGADRMFGGLGSDTYVVDNTGDRVTESTGGAADGVDTVTSNVSFTLGANLEHLTLTGGAARGTGNGLANILMGDDAGNTLVGLGGADTIVGGLGDDRIEGGSGNDLLAGGLYDTHHGASLVDVAFPGGSLPYDGSDWIDGGSGLDTLVYNRFFTGDANDNVTPMVDPGEYVDLAAGTALTIGFSGVDQIRNIENVITANGDDTVIGNDGANEISVNYGFNTVDGGGGDDVIHGGMGLRVAADYIDPVPNYGSGDTIEVLRGGAGDDVIDSGGSIAYYDYSITDGYAELSFTTDVLEGGAGADRLIAGPGNFIMTGGSGADRFEFSTDLFATDRNGYDSDYAQRATITDFNRTQGDKILIDGAATRGVTFVGEDANPDLFELSYHQVSNGGGIDTVIDLPLGYEGLHDTLSEIATLRLTLTDFAGALTQDDFLLV